MDVEEGTISVDGHRVWYRCVGRDGIPLLVLHGGPGAGHDYLEPLEGVATGRRVVFYDQLGCGRSDQPDDSEYEAAVLEFYRRHVCRLDPWPECLQRTVHNLEGNVVYATMNGPNEFMVVGNLKDWDRIDRLGDIKVPTLITVGRYDEITPACAGTLHRGIADAELRLFPNSSHTAHLEETDAYLRVVQEFLAHVEAGRRSG